MACFSIGFIVQLLIMIVVAVAIVKIIGLVVPWLSAITSPIVGQILMILLWAIVAIIAIYAIAALLSCLLSLAGGLHLPR